jgi:myosin heavy subunit
MAHDILEGRRSRRHISAARTIQASFRSFTIRQWFLHVLYAVKLIQRGVRGMAARSKANAIRRGRASTRIQVAYRRFVRELNYERFRWALVQLQSHFRGRSVYKEVQAMKRRVAAVKAQKHIRRYIVQKKYTSFRQAITVLQSLKRRQRAKAVLKQRRAEAKDVGKLQQVIQLPELVYFYPLTGLLNPHSRFC